MVSAKHRPGERAGQPLSRESLTTSGAETVRRVEDNTRGRVSASAPRPGVVADPGMHGRSLHGNREISGLTRRGVGRVRTGKARSRSRSRTASDSYLSDPAAAQVELEHFRGQANRLRTLLAAIEPAQTIENMETPGFRRHP
jgi:hypothetical protein